MRPIDLIRKGWTQGAFARDRNGEGVYSRDKKAVCWCLSGAIIAGFDYEYQRWKYSSSIRKKIKELYGRDDILSWNDDRNRTKKQVLEVMEEVEKSYGRNSNRGRPRC